MKLSSRSLFLWISATIISGLLYFFAFHFFPQTFPIINLSITMDLEQALDKADELAQKYKIGPTDCEYAAMFHTDTNVKTFVELEAGGKDALVKMMGNNLYMPYTWRVRHFKEHEKNEVTFMFTPAGIPYGFIETVSENTPGSQLSQADARAIAEDGATQDWNINLHDYHLVEASQKQEASKRIDHTFVYERKEQTIGEGVYRLKIIVSGSKITQLIHFVKVPEAFNRRYAEMRSANTIIAWAANIIMRLLYLLFGCGFGLYWLIRKRWIIIKQPLQWALLLSVMTLFTSINQLPFLWMNYNSAYAANGFLAQLFLGFLISFLMQTVFYTLIIMAAEGLTRRAFGNQPQLWLLRKPDVINSYAILGRTVGGYLLVGFNCAFVIAFYLFSTRYLNWWSPSEMLFDPNILATYVPWFSPIAQSLNAGFIEECLFRAIPLAGAALLGNYFGKRNWWIGAAFILQAIIFGAAHANYPMQPSYARLVELIIPSFIWGIIYLKFGLLTNIIAHSVYDVIWFSLPIFVSQASNALAYKVIIIFTSLFPLAYIAYARIKKGSWKILPQTAHNSAWSSYAKASADEAEPKKEKAIITKTEPHTLSKKAQYITIALGVIGFITWLWMTPFTHDGVTITLSKNEAVQHVNEFLAQKNITLDAPWKKFPIIFNHYSQDVHIANQHKFIWKEGNKELYHSLLGTYLHPAHWTIRYAQFDTDIVQRAEEHRIMLYDEHIWQYYHRLPESTAGVDLTQQEARILAHKTLHEQFNLNPNDLIEISATQEQLPHRKNWLFVFANPIIYPLSTGQARITITIAGDEIVNAIRTIHVPEEWERNEQHKQNILLIVTIIFFLILLFLLVYALVLTFKQRIIFSFSNRLFVTVAGLLIILFSLQAINMWPSMIGALQTNLPFTNQLSQLIISLIINSLLSALFCAAIISYLFTQKQSFRLPKNKLTVIIGICCGLFIAGIFSIAFKLITLEKPLWPNYKSLGSYIPLLASIMNALICYMQTTIALSLLFILVDTATQQWKINRVFFTIFAMLCGIALFTLPALDLLSVWIVVGATVGWILLAMYKCIFRYDFALIPLATGSFLILQIAQQGIFNAYPGAMLNAVIRGICIGVLSTIWYSMLKDILQQNKIDCVN